MTAQLRILILRPDNIGDAVIFSGALKRIRAHWPQARIDLMVQSHVRALFALCPYIDRLHAVHRLMPWDLWRRYIKRGTWALERILSRDALRRWWYPRADIVIFPVSSPTEPYLHAVRLMSAKEKWGFGGDQLRLYDLQDPANQPERVFTRTFTNKVEDRWQHEQVRMRKFLEFLGVEPGALEPELWLSPRDEAFARRALPERDALGFFVGAGSHWRQWPTGKWIQVGRSQSVSKRLVLFGGRADRSVAAEVESGLRAAGLAVLNLTGKTKICELAACIARCRALVSNDSSGLHLAVAQNVPAVGIMGGYHFGRFYPWGNPRIHRVANLNMDCYYCNDVCVTHDWRCVRDTPVQKVVDELSAAVAANRAVKG